jgi:hypothetical protein
MDLLSTLLGFVTPNAASAEVIPMDDFSRQLVKRIAANPDYSPLYQAAHARPEKVEVFGNPNLYNRGVLGLYKNQRHPQSKASGRTSIDITNNAPEVGGKIKADQFPTTLEQVFGHELTHFLLSQKYPDYSGTTLDEGFATEIERTGVHKANPGLQPLLKELLNGNQEPRKVQVRSAR